MAKALTVPTAPEAPMTPQVSIGERIQGIESRIEEIENISGMNGVSKSRNQPVEESVEESEESNEEQVQSQPQPQKQTRQPVKREVTTPESMARDAVANGSGALTKRTTTRGKDEDNAEQPSQRNQSTVIPPSTSAYDGQSRSERGRAVLNEFQQLDNQQRQQSSSTVATPRPINHSNDNEHGPIYWLFTVVAVVVMAFMFIRQFALKKNEKPFKPSLATPNQVADQYELQNKMSVETPKSKPIQKPIPTPQPTIPKVKPVTLKSKPKTDEDKKGSRFEVRV